MAQDHWIDSGARASDAGEKLMGGPVDFYAENREPRVNHPDWLKAAESKLAALPRIQVKGGESV